MSPKLPKPLLYLITNGQTTARTTPATEDFPRLLGLVEAAVRAGIDLVQIREKNLSAGVLYELVRSAAGVTAPSATRLLVNDRADIAAAAGADGVHLTTTSLPTNVVRRAFGEDFVIGVSTHSALEAATAREQEANFVVFGPVFETVAKSEFGEPQGLEKLREVCLGLKPFPVLALGGISVSNAADCFRAGAHGVAAIGMFEDALRLNERVREVRELFGGSYGSQES